MSRVSSGSLPPPPPPPSLSDLTQRLNICSSSSSSSLKASLSRSSDLSKFHLLYKLLPFSRTAKHPFHLLPSLDSPVIPTQGKKINPPLFLHLFSPQSHSSLLRSAHPPVVSFSLATRTPRQARVFMIMGFQEKRHQVDKGLEMEGKATWVVAGISLRSPLKPVYTSSPRSRGQWDDGEEVEEEFSTTPTGEEARIPAKFTCPPAPRKRKPALKYRYGGVREFFNPPDLESVFMRKAERAN